jgi:hypothetical protein
VTDFELSESDKAQGLWLRLKAHMEEQLDDLRKRNDALQPEHYTASIRGEIRAIKRLIALDADRPDLTGD